MTEDSAWSVSRTTTVPLASGVKTRTCCLSSTSARTNSVTAPGVSGIPNALQVGDRLLLNTAELDFIATVSPQ